MHIRTPAIFISARQHGETAVVARFLTAEYGLVAAYVAGGRGRQLRPVLIPGNVVEVQVSARSDSQLPFAKVELVQSRGPYLGEPLAAAAIGWVCALTATALPERQAYPSLHSALGGLIDAICFAPRRVVGRVGWWGTRHCCCASLAMAGKARGRSAIWQRCWPQWTRWPTLCKTTSLPTAVQTLWRRAHGLGKCWGE